MSGSWAGMQHAARAVDWRLTSTRPPHTRVRPGGAIRIGRMHPEAASIPSGWMLAVRRPHHTARGRSLTGRRCTRARLDVWNQSVLDPRDKRGGRTSALVRGVSLTPASSPRANDGPWPGHCELCQADRGSTCARRIRSAGAAEPTRSGMRPRPPAPPPRSGPARRHQAYSACAVSILSFRIVFTNPSQIWTTGPNLASSCAAGCDQMTPHPRPPRQPYHPPRCIASSSLSPPHHQHHHHHAQQA